MSVVLEDLVGDRVLMCTPITDVNHPFDKDANGIAIVLDGKTYLIFEDPCDGYRSSLGAILELHGMPYEFGGSMGERIMLPVTASMSAEPDEDILVLRSKKTGNEILRIGTANTDD